MKRLQTPPESTDVTTLDFYLRQLIQSVIEEALRPRLLRVFDGRSCPHELHTKLISYLWVEERIIRFAVPSIKDRQFHVFMSLSEMEQKLLPLDFIRVSQNYMINIHEVTDVEWSHHLVRMSDGFHVEYTRTYAPLLERRLSEHLGSNKSLVL